MNIIRKIKINSLGMYEFNDSEKELFKFIKENLLNLKPIVKFDGENDSRVVYYKEKNLIFYYYTNGINNSIYINEKIYKYICIENKRDIIKEILKYFYNIDRLFVDIIYEGDS